jgi:hypothetical protein
VWFVIIFRSLSSEQFGNVYLFLGCSYGINYSDNLIWSSTLFFTIKNSGVGRGLVT